MVTAILESMGRWTFALLATILCACSAQKAHLHGTVLPLAKPAAQIRLVDQNGRPFVLSQTRGQAVALYFGFTHCKDVCPQTLELLSKARALAQLSPAQARLVMVSIDPTRDTPAALRTFFGKLGVAATGLTGPAAKIVAIEKAYGIAVQPQKNDIAHTDVVFLIDSKGIIRELLDPDTPPAEVAADLRALANN